MGYNLTKRKQTIEFDQKRKTSIWGFEYGSKEQMSKRVMEEKECLLKKEEMKFYDY